MANDTQEVSRQIGEVDQSYYLIGIGASAGGLDAIKQLISQLPPDFRHSLVIVQHISPDYKSLMSEILGRETSLPVHEVTDNMAVEPGQIYLIPPRSNIVIQGTKGDSAAELSDDAGKPHLGLRFSLVEPTPRPNLNLPIDVFFHSLSEAVQDRAIAVVLSGSGSDGSRGLRAIKDREGFVLVQDPDFAAFDGMPRSALATGIVDMVVSPDAVIGDINRYIEMRESGIDSVERIFSGANDEFRELLSLVSEKADLDFSQYKGPTLKRRVARRMALRGFGSLADYLAVLRRESAELNVLYREFLVGVTNFFRDRPVWRNLQETVIPSIFTEGHTEVPVRIWSVGCSTGEEAYTIAMLLEDYRSENGIARDVRLFATYVNGNSIDAAKQGIYPDGVRDEIPEEFLNKGYMTLQSGTFSVSPFIRNKVVFSVHNVIEDAPFTRTDMIVCRNLLIYLSSDVQAKMMTHFSFSLRQDGFLQLGAAETPGQHGAMFEALAHKSRTYRNTRQVNPSLRRTTTSLDFPSTSHLLPRTRRMTSRTHSPGQDIVDLFKHVLEDSDTFICIADDSAKVIRTFGDHSGLLNIPSTGFSSNLYELVDERLRSSVALTMRRAETEGSAEKKGIRVVRDDTVDVIDISCRKIAWEAQALAYAVSFRRKPEVLGAQPNVQVDGTETANLPTQAYILHLEGEVQSLQDMLSATAEDLGASNEELQTTNEELIASNEELQANNEETQSINEELHTLNAENAEKIAELQAATGDINNLLAIAAMGILVLDDKLRIRQFSEGISKYIRLEPGDVGRPIENFAMMFETDSLLRLMDDINLSREGGHTSARELQDKDGGIVQCRVRPYRNVHGDQDGVVIRFQDITELKLLEHEVRQQRDRLEHLLESEAAGYWDWNFPEATMFMSPRFKAMLGYDDRNIENTPEAHDALLYSDDVQQTKDAFNAHTASRGKVPYAVENRYIHKDGSIHWMLSRGSVVEWDDDLSPIRMMGVHIDITDMKAREAASQRRAEELRRFAFIAAHDLVQPMNTIDNSITLFNETLPTETVEENGEILEFLTASTRRMKARISGILEFSRIQDEAFEFAPVDLNGVVTDCIEDLSSQVAETKAEIEVGNLPKVMGAYGLVLRVIQNLLSNALKYRSPDRPLNIWIEDVSGHDGKASIIIKDNGIGIAPEHRKKVFELYARLHTEEDYPGRGLGLTLSERIMEQLEGSVVIEDGVDGGTAFRVTFRSAE